MGLEADFKFKIYPICKIEHFFKYLNLKVFKFKKIHFLFI